MKLLKTVLSGLTLYKEDLTINFVATQRVSAEAREHLNKITGNIYTNPVIELAGLNASGKTMTLKIIMLVFSILNGDKLDTLHNKELYLALIGKKPITVRSYFFWENKFYVLITKIGKRRLKKNPAEESLWISEEKLFVKKPGVYVTKSNWEENPAENNDFYKLLIDRKDAGDFLLDDISVNVSIVNKAGSPITCCDFLGTVNHNLLMTYGDYLPEVIDFLDPNIEYLKTERLEDSNKIRWRLKFKNRDKVFTLNTVRDLEFYLSSGTIKGIGIFMMAVAMFCDSGYLVIDELENHFNLKIVKCLLELFQNHKTNKIGATIIFSTHYPELLDVAERNDAIYILSNDGKISCENLSLLKSRNDGMKVSQAFVQNLLEKTTAPSYQSFIELKKVIANMECRLNEGNETNWERVDVEV